MVTLSSDHVIRNHVVWLEAMRAGIAHARSDSRLVTFGIPPDDPSSKYGYINAGDSFDPVNGFIVYKVVQFVEKPDTATLTEMLVGHHCLRNTGMFAWRCQVYLEELGLLLSRTAETVCKVTEAGHGVDPDTYASLPSISVDHAILQKSKRVSVVEAEIDRIDLGDFGSLKHLWDKDEAGNATIAPVYAVDSENNIAYATETQVALVGVSDLIVVATDETVLVCHTDSTQSIRDVVALIEAAAPESDR
jgi:mannose-1-phosphate guanylyltransferase/mannose-6-phosphate isomerase